jgi:hypothetical protein
MTRTFLILILSALAFAGCASGPYDSRSFSERAEPQVRAAMQFSACPYGEESADITTRSETAAVLPGLLPESLWNGAGLSPAPHNRGAVRRRKEGHQVQAEAHGAAAMRLIAAFPIFALLGGCVSTGGYVVSDIPGVASAVARAQIGLAAHGCKDKKDVKAAVEVEVSAGGPVVQGLIRERIDHQVTCK